MPQALSPAFSTHAGAAICPAALTQVAQQACEQRATILAHFPESCPLQRANDKLLDFAAFDFNGIRTRLKRASK